MYHNVQYLENRLQKLKTSHAHLHKLNRIQQSLAGIIFTSTVLMLFAPKNLSTPFFWLSICSVVLWGAINFAADIQKEHPYSNVKSIKTAALFIVVFLNIAAAIALIVMI